MSTEARPRVVAFPITLVEPLLVLALELVVENHAVNARTLLGQALGRAQICLTDLRIVFELARLTPA